MTKTTSRSPKADRRAELCSLLGDLPPRDRAAGAELVLREERESYVLETLTLDLNGSEPVPAYFTKPKGEGAWPVVLYNHSHGGGYSIGKRELLEGREYLGRPPYAEELARRGIAALAIDHWLFGERSGRSESELFKEMLWRGRVLWGEMVYDSLKTIDYLATRPDVERGRIGTLGISMGSTMAWWVAALDERVKVCVDICCLTEFEALIEARGLDGHGVYYYVPGLLKRFSTADINALIAPRPHLALAGEYDRLTPPKGLDVVDAELRAVYAAEGAPAAWRLLRYPCGHQETAAMRAEIVRFLGESL